MNRLPIEKWFDILIILPYRDILNYCIANPEMENICQDPSFWRMKYEYDFGKIPGLTVDEDWRYLYETRMKDINFLETGEELYALIDNKGQLFIGSFGEPLEMCQFNERITYLTLSMGKQLFDGLTTPSPDIGVVTENGNAYILLSEENYEKFHNITPQDKSVRKIKLISDSFEQVPFLIYFLILDGDSVEYNILSTDKEIKNRQLVLSDPVRDIIYDDDSKNLHILTWNNQIHIYYLEVKINENGDAIWNITHQKTISLPIFPQKIFYYSSNYIILSKGDIFVYNNESTGESLRQIVVPGKVKWIHQSDEFFSILTENGKLYLWIYQADNRIRWYIPELNENRRTPPEDRQGKYITNQPVEMNLSDKSNERYNIMASARIGQFVYGNRVHQQRGDEYASVASTDMEIFGLSLTADGKILEWDFHLILNIYE